MYKDDFTPEDNTRNQNLFEDLQSQLELEVERLAEVVRHCGSLVANCAVCC